MINPPNNPYISYAEQTQRLHKAFEAVVKETEKATALLNKGMASDYSKMLIRLKRVLADAHEQYATTERLSWTEMERYQRIQIMENRVNAVIQQGYAPIRTKVLDESENLLERTYAMSLRAIEGIPNTSPIQTLTGDQIDEILSRPWSGLTMDERIALRTNDLGVRVNSQIKRDLMGDGATYSETAKGITKIVTKDYASMKTVTNDEFWRVQTEGEQAAMDQGTEDGLEITKTWVTAGDNDVRDAHKLLDGQTVLADEQFEIPSGEWKGWTADGPGLFGEPALDNHCRCWLVAGVRKKE